MVEDSRHQWKSNRRRWWWWFWWDDRALCDDDLAASKCGADRERWRRRCRKRLVGYDGDERARPEHLDTTNAGVGGSGPAGAGGNGDAGGIVATDGVRTRLPAAGWRWRGLHPIQPPAHDWEHLTARDCDAVVPRRPRDWGPMCFLADGRSRRFRTARCSALRLALVRSRRCKAHRSLSGHRDESRRRARSMCVVRRALHQRRELMRSFASSYAAKSCAGWVSARRVGLVGRLSLRRLAGLCVAVRGDGVLSIAELGT